ncbi:histone deacetylase family protein [Oceaniglobus trochenteri]|uniref:histone deacetylase family protein n=1 Tax=Oceaniglobus trochenteri TaxID=2763260 RepID=UPI001CFFA80C|nr:histone deacetylase family protein [Oceaniglobus trochenteri]
MRCFFAPETDAHDPRFYLVRGQVAANKELPQRAALLIEGLAQAGMTTEAPAHFPEAALSAIHSDRYLDFLRHAHAEWQALPDQGAEVVANVHPAGPVRAYPKGIVGRAGWHMADAACPMGPHSWAAARRSADTALAAAQAVVDGARAAYALCRPPGHHALAEVAGGHCLLNNAAIAAQHLRRHHDRVAVLDIDVHHGNGTQGIFWTRGDVLTVSVHAETSAYYPFFTGYADETGEGDGKGANLNIPLPRDETDDAWCAAIETALARIAAFNPGALVLSLGLDAHEADPLRGLAVTTPAFGTAARLIAGANLPTAIVQEGGYLSRHLSANLSAFMIGWNSH